MVCCWLLSSLGFCCRAQICFYWLCCLFSFCYRVQIHLLMVVLVVEFTLQSTQSFVVGCTRRWSSVVEYRFVCCFYTHVLNFDWVKIIGCWLFSSLSFWCRAQIRFCCLFALLSYWGRFYCWWLGSLLSFCCRSQICLLLIVLIVENSVVECSFIYFQVYSLLKLLLSAKLYFVDWALWWNDVIETLRKAVLSHCWQDEPHILTMMVPQGPVGNLGAVAGSSGPWRCRMASTAWAPGLTQQESCLILRKTTPSRSSGEGWSCQTTDNAMAKSRLVN